MQELHDCFIWLCCVLSVLTPELPFGPSLARFANATRLRICVHDELLGLASLE